MQYMFIFSGHAFKFQLRFKRAEGYPVDLYYLMDLSYSMDDDLKNVKDLGIEILKKLQSITGNARIGKILFHKYNKGLFQPVTHSIYLY